MAHPILTAARLREVFHYAPETGVLTNRITRGGGRAKAGAVAGFDHKGYRRVSIDGKTYCVHHLIWFFVTGAWPAGEIDHRDGDKANNRFENLRPSSRSLNMQNQRRARSDSRSGLLGVMVNGKRWAAQINLGNGMRKGLGTFDTPQEAHAAYIEAKRRLHEGCTI